MSNKWLKQLDKDEMLKLHLYIIGEGNAVECIRLEPNGDETIYVTFLEDWPDEHGHSVMEEMDYELDDFDGELSFVDGSSKNGVRDFREWMIKRFGVEYVDELVKEKLDINLIDYLDWSQTNEEDSK